MQNITNNTLIHISEMLNIGKSFLQILGVFGTIFNLYVIACLLTTKNYVIIIPYLELNGNVCLAIAIFIELLLIMYLFIYRNVLLSFCVNLILVSTGAFVLKSFVNTSDDNGLITKNSIFSVYYNYTKEEKLSWISRLESDYSRSLKQFTTDNILTKVNCYNDLKNHIERSIAEEKLKTVPESTNILSSIGNWMFDHKALILGVMITAGAIGYIYYKGFLFSGVLSTLKESGKVHQKTGEQITDLATKTEALNNRLRLLIDEQKRSVVTSDNLQGTMCTIDEKLFVVTDTVVHFQESVKALSNKIENIQQQLTEISVSNEFNNVGIITEQIKRLKLTNDTTIQLLDTMANQFNNKLAILAKQSDILKTHFENLDTEARRVLTEHALRLDALEGVSTLNDAIDNLVSNIT